MKDEIEARGLSANALAIALRTPSGRITDILNGKRAARSPSMGSDQRATSRTSGRPKPLRPMFPIALFCVMGMHL
jgi:hypothetical protein